MNSPQQSPLNQLNEDQQSYISDTPYRQAQLPYQMPKIDHAFITENYRRLRIKQQDVLAKLRMPDKLKRKIFNFKQDQDLKYEKPNLIIFNHPFRGKTVMTKEQVEKQLQRERRNAEGLADQRQPMGKRVDENFLNQMGLSQEQVTIRMAKFATEKQKKEEQIYPRKARLVSEKPQKQLAQQINEKADKKLKGNMYFLQKQTEKQQTEKQRTQKMRKLIRQKQDSSERNQQSKFKSRGDSKTKQFRDMPIIGQQPKVIRDIQYEDEHIYDRDKDRLVKVNTKQNVKEYYRPFGNENEVREMERTPGMVREYEYEQKMGSGEGLVRKKGREESVERGDKLNKSISEISAIESKNDGDDLSNSQSLNKELFLG